MSSPSGSHGPMTSIVNSTSLVRSYGEIEREYPVMSRRFRWARGSAEQCEREHINQCCVAERHRAPFATTTAPTATMLAELPKILEARVLAGTTARLLQRSKQIAHSAESRWRSAGIFCGFSCRRRAGMPFISICDGYPYRQKCCPCRSVHTPLGSVLPPPYRRCIQKRVREKGYSSRCSQTMPPK